MHTMHRPQTRVLGTFLLSFILKTLPLDSHHCDASFARGQGPGLTRYCPCQLMAVLDASYTSNKCLTMDCQEMCDMGK